MPLMVAYRDGFTVPDATDPKRQVPIAWKTAPASKSVDLMIENAYSIMVVCQLDPGTVLVWQAFHTVGDDTTKAMPEPTLETGCQPPAAAPPTVTGTLAQKGIVHLGDADTSTAATAPFDFSLQVATGTYDLVATTDNADPSTNKTLIQHGIMVTGPANLGTFDASTGVAQMPLMLALSGLPNPAKSTETVAGKVTVTTKNNATGAPISKADYDLKNKTIKLFGVPNSALGAGETQTAVFTGTNHIKDTNITTTRSVATPFSVGDDVSKGNSPLALPAAIVIPDWAMDNNRLSVALPALPALDDLTIMTSGTSTDGTTTVNNTINISSDYFAQTALARPVFDTDVTGFQAAWKIDFTKPYSRTIAAERDAFTKGVFVDHEMSEFSEEVNQ